MHTETNHGKDASTGRTKTWSVPRQGYSYSDNIALKQIDILGDNNTPDILSDSVTSPGVPSEKHDPDVHRQNVVNSLKHCAAG